MKDSEIQNILERFRGDEITDEEAVFKLKNLSFEDLGYARVDHGRAQRQGFPEVIFGLGKTSEQICGIFETLLARTPNLLITRTTKDVFGDICNIYSAAQWHESASLIRVMRDHEDRGTGE